MSQERADSSQTVARSTWAFLSGTALSRLTGFARDTATAIAFGSDPAIAAFMVAFRFANLIRRLFGEGPLSSGFVPYFEQKRAESLAEGGRFFRDLFFSLTCFLLGVIGILELGLWALLKLGDLEASNAQIVQLTMQMLPGILFICLFGLTSALLQCKQRFFLTGFAPALFNAVWIAGVALVWSRSAAEAVFFLGGAVVVAFFAQWGVLAPQTLRELKKGLSFREMLRPRLFSPELRRLVRPLLLGMVGVSAVQVNSALDALFARSASLEGPAYLWYAIRIEQIPLALFGIALSSALLPPLARAIKEGARERYLSLVRFAMRRGFSLILPCFFGLLVLGVSGINLLYGHGHFSSEAVYETTLCLWGYALGLVPSVFVLFLAPAFYADKEFGPPLRGSLLSVALHILLNTCFVYLFDWGAFSIAISTSLAAWCNYAYLSRALAKKMGERLSDEALGVAFTKVVWSGLCAFVGTLLVGFFFVGDPTLSILFGASVPLERVFSFQLMQWIALSGTFCIFLFLSARLFKAYDLLAWVGMGPSSAEK
jgi:putative peptidoglycan lipid II flippase